MPIQIVRQDITRMHVDAIVNTTNEKMIGYSGVDLAVRKAAGEEMDAECRKIAPLGLGQAKITGGYKLPAKYVIHTSGPIWKGGLSGESIILRSCYMESLKLAVKYGLESIAFPLISAGTYGYPKEQVLTFAIQTIKEFLTENEIDVYICVYDKTSYTFSKQLFNDIKAFIDEDYIKKRVDIRRNIPDAERFNIREYASFEALEAKQLNTFEESRSYSRSSVANKSLDEYMKNMDKPFALKLFDLIDERGMTDIECYKRANIDRRTFSKIKSNAKTYKPTKQTAVAFAVALKLNLEETQDLLASAGMTLSRGIVFDKIIRYFIQKEIYDIHAINEALFEFDQKLLGV